MKKKTVFVINENLMTERLVKYINKINKEDPEQDLNKKPIQYYVCNGKELLSNQKTPYYPYSPVANLIAEQRRDYNVVFVGCRPSKRTLEILNEPKDSDVIAVKQDCSDSEIMVFSQKDISPFSVIEDALIAHDALEKDYISNVKLVRTNKSALPVVKYSIGDDTYRYSSTLTEYDLEHMVAGQTPKSVRVSRTGNFRGNDYSRIDIRRAKEIANERHDYYFTDEILPKENMKIKFEQVGIEINKMSGKIVVDPSELSDTLFKIVEESGYRLKSKKESISSTRSLSPEELAIKKAQGRFIQQQEKHSEKPPAIHRTNHQSF